MSRALCIDLGGTHLRAGLLDDPGAGAPAMLGAWHAPDGPAAFRTRICGLIETHRADRLGIAVPGLTEATRCTWIPNLPWLDGADLARLFPDVPIALGNDAQLALLAEATRGAAADLGDAILLAIGTGIGSAVLSDGRILRGHGGGATSFGWASADPGDAGDPRHGWLERQASGRALDRRAAALGLADGHALIERARGGDPAARELLSGPAAALATTLSGAVALLGTRGIVVTGGVADGLDVLAPLIRPVLERQLPPHLKAVGLVRGSFGAGASLLGAGLAAQGSPLWREPAR